MYIHLTSHVLYGIVIESELDQVTQNFVDFLLIGFDSLELIGHYRHLTVEWVRCIVLGWHMCIGNRL